MPVSVSFHGTRVSGSLTSLSLGGASIVSPLSIAEGALVQLEIHVPGASPIAIDGALVRSARPAAVGLQFIWAQPHAKDRLRELVLRALGHEDVAEAMALAKGPGVRSPLGLGDFW